MFPTSNSAHSFFASLRSQTQILLGAVCLSLAACTGANDTSNQMISAVGLIVVNEVYPSGSDPATNPDWVEFKNLGTYAFDLASYRVRDDTITSVLPAGSQRTIIQPGGYLLVYCDDLPDGGAIDRVHLPFKLGGKDEFYLLAPDGTQVDGTAWDSTTVTNGRSFGRLPDGTGQFLSLTPTPNARNL